MFARDAFRRTVSPVAAGGSGGKLMEDKFAPRLRMIQLGGWSACVSGTIAALGLVLWFARFAFPAGPVGWFNDLLVMIQYGLALPIASDDRCARIVRQ